MGRFEKIAVTETVLQPEAPELVIDPNSKSLLTDAQNEELRQILLQPIEIATDEEMEEVFGNWGD